MLLALIIILFAYLSGSVSSAIITCKLMNLPDPRTLGSKNPGATNVLRIGGKKGRIAAAITLLGDSLKGLIPVTVVIFAGQSSLIIAFSAIAAFLGHLYPVFFGFKGGKGVATAFGAILAIAPLIALCLAGCWLFMAFVLKISSLSALISALLAPLLFYLLQDQGEYVWMSVLISTLLIYRHKSNIENLLNGKEDKISSSQSQGNSSEEIDTHQ